MKKVNVYYDPIFLQHNTGAGHPESADRLRKTMAALEAAALPVSLLSPEAATKEDILRCHTEIMFEKARLCSASQEAIDADTKVSHDSFMAAMHAAGSGITAIKALANKEADFAFCAMRPPGHHATATQSMGFCLFNSIAVAARYLQAQGLAKKIAIVDWDVHHGNGTQDIFYTDKSVFFASIHQGAFYPGTGHSHEVGEADGMGFTLNIPLPAGVPNRTYRDNFQFLLDRVQEFAPDYILLSAGFDSHRDDPLGGFLLEEEDFRWMTKRLRHMAADESAKIISFLEGGYNTEALAQSVVAHVEALVDDVI